MASTPTSPELPSPVLSANVVSGSVLPRQVLYNGSTIRPPRQIELRAGAVSLLFEPDLTQIRRLRIGSLELLRAVYGAVRDRNWDTVLPRVGGLSIHTTEESFSVRFTADCLSEQAHFQWHGELDGDADGQIRFHFRGRALRPFARNRIGLCVLHDADTLPGRAVHIEHVDGHLTRSVFPSAIAPHQPFLNIRAIRYPVWDGLEAEVRMEGDTFEMEDQRNWTDASYKTYSTPLALPFPVELPQGAEVRQTVTFRLVGTGPSSATGNPPAFTPLRLSPQIAHRMPAIGTCVGVDAPPLSAAQAQRFRAAGVAHLRVDLHLYQPNWPALWERALAESALLGAPLELALHLSDAAATELGRLAATLEGRSAHVARLLVFHRDEKSTTAPWLALARQHIQPLLPQVPIGSGSNAYFTEVNRERPPIELSQCVAWSSNPQVHAFDNLSLAETIPMYRAVLESAREFSGNVPLVVSPITLKPRFNPNATATRAEQQDRLPETVDPRQMSLFGAGWTLGVLRSLASGGAHAATFYETTGWRGWMETQAGSPAPELFPSLPGAVFPLYHVLADWGEFAGGEVLDCGGRPCQLEAVALRHQQRLRLLLANLTGQTSAVLLDASGMASRIRIKTLDECTVMEAMQQPDSWRGQPGALQEAEGGQFRLTLLPYAVLRLDAVRDA